MTRTHEHPPTPGPPWWIALDVWMALGGDSQEFDQWAFTDDDRSTWGDRWSQLLAAIRRSDLTEDTNPPAGRLIPLAASYHATPSPVLPEGVRQAFVIDAGRYVPVGWERVDRPTFRLNAKDSAVEVRPIAPPETEDVQWWEAVGRVVRKGNDEPALWSITRVSKDADRVSLVCANGFCVAPNPDGTVTVLCETGEQG